MRLSSRRSLVLAVVVTMGGGSILATGPARATHAMLASPSAAIPSGTRVYWDQNEEMDWLIHDGVQQNAPLVPAWDANGQMCVFPDSTGRFTTAYNPTDSGQTG